MFKTFFSNVVNELNIEKKEEFLDENINEFDPVLNAINKYRNHPSVLDIKETVDQHVTFSFQLTERESIMHEILLLDVSKASPKTLFLQKLLKRIAIFFLTNSLVILIIQ